ncbi:MAG: urea ABC transporter permease subunit UrtB, partial [Halomonas sp.]|nr:urea ABC transporter permease subunit UrtB [Halomonas sp.]
MKIPPCLRRLLALCLLACLPLTAQAQEDTGRSLLESLDAASYARMGGAIEAIVESGDPRSRGWLEALLDGKLQRHKESGRFVVVLENRGRHWPVADALSGEALGEMSRRELDRIGINNALRGQLQSVMAVLDLRVDDVGARREAARDLLGRVDEAMVAPLQDLLEAEGDAEVSRLLEQGLAIHRLGQGSVEAVSLLSGSLNGEVRAALGSAARSDDPALAEAAQAALADIDQKLRLNRGLETLYFGLSLGSVLVLAAIGLAITFGVMGVINMAHGELMMLGAYTTWAMQQLLPGQPGLALLLAIPAGFLVAAL